MARTSIKKRPLFVVRKSKIQGKGVFAARRIRKGQRVVEYVGEIISRSEETERYNDLEMERHHTFLFEVTDDITIDAGRIGGPAKWINHSCEPNCEAVNDDDRIYIEAIKNIQPGVELSYNYQFELGEKLTKSLVNRYPCHCGSPRCKGTILKVSRKKLKELFKKGK